MSDPKSYNMTVFQEKEKEKLMPETFEDQEGENQALFCF